MATQLERIADSFSDPAVRALLQDESLRRYRGEMKTIRKVNPYAVTGEAAKFLENQGVGTDPYAPKLHSHAADKALENATLERVAYFMGNVRPGPVTFMQLKPGKLKYMTIDVPEIKAGRPTGNRVQVNRLAHYQDPKVPMDCKDQFINWHHEGRDLSRFTSGLATPAARLGAQHIRHEIAFMSDTLHFLQPEDIAWLFAQNRKLQELVATVVLPVEALQKMPSLFPEVYTLEYFKDGSFAYYPGGHGGAGYHHPATTLQWLETGRIVMGPLTITIDKLESMGAHHILHFTRRPVAMPTRWMYATEAYARVPELYHPEHANAQRPYPVVMLQQMHAYLHSVKAVSMRDIHAKLRSIIPTKELHLYSAKDKICLANYFFYVASLDALCDYDTKPDKGVIGRFLSVCKSKFRPAIEKLLGKSEFAQLLELSELEHVSFTTQPRTVTLGLSLMEKLISGPKGPTNQLPAAPEYWGFDLDSENSDGESDCASSTSSSSGSSRPPPGFDAEALAAEEELVAELTEELYTPAEAQTTPEPTAPLPAEDVEQPAPADELEEKPEAVNEEVISDADGAGFYPKHLVKVLNDCGFHDLSPQFGPVPKSIARKNKLTRKEAECQRIPAVSENPEKLPHCDWPEEIPDTLVDTLTNLARLPHEYQVDKEYAGAYANGCKHGHVGLLTKRQGKDWLLSLDARCENSEAKVALVVIHGAGGSGKSRALQEALRQDSDLARMSTIIVPTNELRKDWQDKLPTLDRRAIKTFERGLIEGVRPIVIMDDYGKLPTGYVDAVIAACPTMQLLVLTGDKRQSVYHCPNKQAKIALLADNVQHFEPFCDYYVNASHRMPRNFGNALFVHTSRADDGAIGYGPSPPDDRATLIPSNVGKETLEDLGNEAYTYSGCQGLTRPHIAIVLDKDTQWCSEQVMYTACSRAQESIYFVNTWSEADAFQAKLNRCPYLKTLLSMRREVEEDPAREAPMEDTEEKPYIKTHIAVENAEALEEEVVAELPEKYMREHWDPALREHTNLAQTEDMFVQAVPHQQANDDALLWWTIQNRLNRADPRTNKLAMQQKKAAGSLLFEAFKARMHLKGSGIPYNPTLWAECEAEVERAYLSKTEEQLANGSARQDPDFDDDFIALFNKSQYVRKEEKLAQPLKAGQTIASFKQTVVMRYGVMARYARRVLNGVQPKHIFINSEKTPKELDQFVMEFWDFTRDNFTSDFTQYDQSQDASFLNFEVMLMRYLNVPSHVIEGYIWIKCHARVFAFQLAIMRLSGEGPTLDFNTYGAVAFDALMYEVGDTVAVHVGDDFARDKVCALRRTWAKHEKHFTLTAKPCVTRKPDFCGWRFTPHGIIKSPRKLWAGLLHALKIGKMNEIIRNYGNDFTYSVRLGDLLYDVYDEQELKYHHAIMRMLLKHGFNFETGQYTPAYHIRSDKYLAMTRTERLRSEWAASDRARSFDAEIKRMMPDEDRPGPASV